MNKAPRIIIPLVIVALIVGIVIWRIRTADKGPSNTIVGNGVVEATEVDVSSQVGGKITILLVHEGDNVIAGQLIATLDGGVQEGQVQQATGAVSGAQANKRQADIGTRAEELRRFEATLEAAQAAQHTAAAQVDAAAQQHNQTVAQLQLVEAGPREEDIAGLRAQVAQAQAALDNAKDDLTRVKFLNDNGAVSDKTLVQAQTVVEADTQQVAAAQSRLDAALNGARPEELTGARAAVAAAKAQVTAATRVREQAAAQVKAAQAALDEARNGTTQETKDLADAQVAQAKGALKSATEVQGQTRIIAPCDGRVTLRNVEPGELVTPGQPIIRIADLKHVWTRVYVQETMIGKLKLGQHATVVTDSFGKKVFTGTVSEIAETPEFTPKNVQTKEERVKLVFGIKIALDNPDQELKPGMPADASIMIKE